MPPDQHRSSLCDDLSCAGGHGWDDVQWSKDGTHLAFVSTSRDHKQEWLRVADAANGDVRDVMSETATTYFESADSLGIGKDKLNWRYLPQSNEVLWFSERDNWGQLYLYDLNTGKLKIQITHGDGDVTQVLHVDEKARVIYFLAVGKEAGRDPYFAALHRVNFDGTGMKLLTPEDADHDVTMSPDGRDFIDVASTPERPATAVVRDDDGNVLVDVAQQDVAKLRATGWKPLTPITVKARDGKTVFWPRTRTWSRWRNLDSSWCASTAWERRDDRRAFTTRCMATWPTTRFPTRSPESRNWRRSTRGSTRSASESTDTRAAARRRRRRCFARQISSRSA